MRFTKNFTKICKKFGKAQSSLIDKIKKILYNIYRKKGGKNI
jgi:hypothetical protein